VDEGLLIPARMVNEWVYCPRLAWLEWIDGEWEDSADTVHGRFVHRRVDADADDALPGPDEMPVEGTVIARGVMLSAPDDHLIAKMDLIEAWQDGARPVDYKRGSVPENGPWPPEKVQLCAQALVLRANGYRVEEGVLFFATSRRRVAVPIDDALVALTRGAVAEMLAARAAGVRPPPLVDSPKCGGCSLASICLPDEVSLLTGGAAQQAPPPDGLRRVHPARDDALPVHVAEQGAVVGKRGDELRITRKGVELARARIPGTSSVGLYGNVTITTPALRALLDRGVPVSFYSYGGWLSGMAAGYATHGLELRRAQYKAAEDERRLLLARRLVRTKLANQRTFLRRNHRAAPDEALRSLKAAAESAEAAAGLDTLLGCEGDGARVYFQNFGGMLKPPGEMAGFSWERRTRRPPTDPVNAALGFAYALLVREWTSVLARVGFDPLLGFLHQPRPGRPALSLDMMEEFRPILADSVVLGAINNGELVASHFVRTAEACGLTADGRKALLRAWERRLDTLVTHPVFGYRLSYRRVFEVQARLLARHLLGELDSFPEFRVR
jgi:CRISP-associated protein Cas1